MNHRLHGLHGLEMQSESQPHPWHYVALAIILVLIVLFGAAVYVTGQSFSPESFAAAAQAEALIAENVRHSEQMHTLQEQDQANADAHAAQRRQYLTWFTFGLAASLTGLAALAVLTCAPVLITWSARRSVEHVARLMQVWHALPNQPMPIPLPNGYTALPPTLAEYTLQDDRTGQRSPLVEPVEASDHRTHLEQVDAVRESVEQVAHRDARGVSAWLPGILQKLVSNVPIGTPPPHRRTKPLVFRRMARNQNQKTKKANS